MPTLRIALPALALVAAAAGCGASSSGGSRPAAADGSNPPSALACPSPSGAGDTFPQGAASKVPHPAYARSPKRLPVAVTGEDEVQFTTATPLSVSAAFVQREYAAAGYRIVGGDAEAHEADILWAHAGGQGKTKLSGSGCTTTWTVLALPRGKVLHDKEAG